MNEIKSEVYSWAAETSQEHVAIEICKAWFLSGERSECINSTQWMMVAARLTGRP